MKPYFAGNAPEIHLDLSSRHRAYSNEEKVRLRVLNAHWDGGQDILVPSSLEWTVGRGGSPELRRWGNRLKTWFVRSAVGLSDGRQTFWAFPSALAKLKGGMAYYSLGWDLSRSIQTAQLQPRSPEARDLVPPREVVIGPDWLQWAGGIVAAIARRIYEERAFHDLPILADALEEAGCTETDILVHLRGPGPHNRSCWALDALLERP